MNHQTKWLAGCRFDFFSVPDLLPRIGPAPTVGIVAQFLRESSTTTWRRLRDGQLRAVGGPGTTRITLESLLAYLNGSQDYQLTHKRGRKSEDKKGKASAKPEPAKAK
jgi:hypothetical protein